MIQSQFVESLKKNRSGIILMVFTSLCICFGQLFWKVSYSYGTVCLLPGFLLYGTGTILMIFAYRFGNLSALHPVLSLNYVITIILGYYVLGEQISTGRMAGVVIIIIGVFLVCGGDS